MQTLEALQMLTQSAGPCGFEERAVQTAAALLRPLVEEVRIERLGGVTGVRRCGRPNAKRVALVAHLDEVGLIVTGHEKGFLRFATLGGIDPRVLLNREVTLLTEPPQFGLITGGLPREEPDRAAPLSELFIDVGRSEREAEEIPIGTPIVYRERTDSLGEDCYAGKALDDRSCFLILLRMLEQLRDRPLDVDLYVLGSVGEETDSRGAITAAYDLAPDCAVALDVTFGRAPDCGGDECFALGGGPVIGVGPNITEWMFERMKEKAESLTMPYQIEVMVGGGTDGWDIQILREGIPTAVLSLPQRNMHTPVEVVDRRDMEACARLLAAFVEGIGEEALECANC